MLRARARSAIQLLGLVCLGIIAPFASAAHEPSVLRATLPNGLRVVIVHNALAPVVTTELNYLVGSNEAPAGFPGMAHALEHMMFRGSPGLSKDQLAEISAAMGGEFDADTQNTVTQYYFTVPAADLDVALHIDALRMRGLDLSARQWNKERGAIEQEVAHDRSNPQYLMFTELQQALFKGTPYEHDALGTRPSFNRTTVAMLKQFYHSWYAPNNAILVIVGDIAPQAALKQVEALYAGIPARSLPARPSVTLRPVKAAMLHRPTDLPYGLTLIAFRLPGFDNPDYAASVILGDVLNSPRGSLYALVPAGKALYAGFGSNAMPGAGIGFALGVFPKGGHAAALTEEIRQVLRQILAHGVSANLVSAAKRGEIASFEFEKNSIAGLANAWSDALALQGRPAPDALVAALRKVTVADVDRVARTYLQPDHSLVAVLTPEVSGKPISTQGYGGAESFASTPHRSVPLPAWAKTALARLTLPMSTVNPVVSRLPNGITLIVQPEQVSDTVSVYGRIRNQPTLQQPTGQEGVSEVLDGLFSYGTDTLDRIAFQKALDDIAAEETAGTEFSLEVPAAHFVRGIQLLADNELHPALPASAFGVVRTETARFVAGNLQSPDYLFERAGLKALVPAGDPTLREATPRSIMGLTLADVQGYYGHAFRPDLTTIVVIGKVTPAGARAVVARYFGGWRAAGVKPKTTLPPIPLSKPSMTVVPDQSSVQDQVALMQSLGVNLFSPDRYALELGNQVLGRGFYASRLYRDLREKTGLVYNVNSTFSFTATRGVFEVEYGSDPGNVDKARTLILRDLAAMQAAPVTPVELRRAKALLLRGIVLGESSVGHIAGTLLSDSIEGLPLDEPSIAAHHYIVLTAASVEAAYRRWVRPADLAEVVKGPAPR